MQQKLRKEQALEFLVALGVRSGQHDFLGPDLPPPFRPEPVPGIGIEAVVEFPRLERFVPPPDQ